VIAAVLAVLLAASGPHRAAAPAAAGAGVAQADTAASSLGAGERAAPADSSADRGASGVEAVRAEPSSPGDGAPAGAPAATGPRVPGSWLRLDMTEGQVLGRGAFDAAPGERGFVTRKGAAPWYGLPATATLKFRADLLARAEFVVEDTAPYWVDYVRDQLRIAGYRARCERDEPGLVICDWEGATHVRFELRQRRLLAVVSASESVAPGAARPAPAATPQRTASAPRDTVPVFPQVFVLGRAAPPGVTTVPSLVDSTPLLRPPYPDAAREAGVQGRVWVRALVDTNGAIEAAEIVRSIPELDGAALTAARSCRFRPYQPAGSAVRFRVEIPVMFTVR
jgi:TonB family protein